MKRILILALLVLLTGTSFALVDDDRPIAVNQLPQKAQLFIKEHFPKEKVAYAKIERDFLEVKYEVVFASGSKVEFRKNGDWKEVDCRYTAVPAAIIPSKIIESVANLYPDNAIVQIDRNRRDYEVKITNGLELTYDLAFNLIEIDD